MEPAAFNPDDSLRRSWSGLPAFEIQGQSFSFLDVLQAAEVRGDLQSLVARSCQAADAERHATAEELDPDLPAVESMIDAFRYERDLVTVEETEAWLNLRALTVDDLADHFMRRYWAEAAPNVRPATGESVDTEPLPAAAWAADLFLRGDFARLARQLAREVLLARSTPEPAADATPAPEAIAAFRTRRGFDAGTFATWCEAWGLDDALLAGFLNWQEGFAARLRAVITPENRTALLAEQFAMLKQVELEVIEFDTEDVAREAFLCATADGLGLDALAIETGYPLIRRAGFVGRLPASWRLAVACASPGRVLDPVADDGTFHLCRLIREHPATPEDPAVIAELDGELIQRHCGAVETEDVRWHIELEGAS